jgi:hypothetical protein
MSIIESNLTYLAYSSFSLRFPSLLFCMHTFCLACTRPSQISAHSLTNYLAIAIHLFVFVTVFHHIRSASVPSSRSPRVVQSRDTSAFSPRSYPPLVASVSAFTYKTTTFEPVNFTLHLLTRLWPDHFPRSFERNLIFTLQILKQRSVQFCFHSFHLLIHFEPQIFHSFTSFSRFVQLSHA